MPADGVFLDKGWFPREVSDGRPFRWVEREAGVVVTAPGPARKLLIEVEPGPGTGGQPLKLGIVDAGGVAILEKTVAHRTAVQVQLPAPDGSAVHLKLIARNGGSRTAADPRVLDFRVFDLAVAK